MYLYVAYPIDQANPDTDSPMNMALAHLHSLAYDQGHTLFRPGAAHRIGGSLWNPDDVAAVDRINRSAIWESNGLVAVLLPGIPTLGTPAEIEHALTLNRPVLILTTSLFAATSVQLVSWARRGATVRHLQTNGHFDDFNLAEALSQLPDPTRLAGELLDHPKMLIAGEAANCQRGKYEGDAGIDLAISQETLVGPFGSATDYNLIPTGVRAAIPDGYFGLITGRSSTWSRYRCQVQSAVIDSGYRGELMVGILNKGSKVQRFGAGQRLAQMILLPTWAGQVEWTHELPQHERGENGYGSSGR